MKKHPSYQNSFKLFTNNEESINDMNNNTNIKSDAGVFATNVWIVIKKKETSCTNPKTNLRTKTQWSDIIQKVLTALALKISKWKFTYMAKNAGRLLILT